MPNKKQVRIRRLERGDSLEITLASDALFVTNRTNEIGENQGFILPADISVTRPSNPGIRRLGYFGGFYGNRIIVYEYVSCNRIDPKSSNWFTELEAIHSLKYISQKSGTKIPISELRKQTYKK